MFSRLAVEEDQRRRMSYTFEGRAWRRALQHHIESLDDTANLS
jgi:hypothetical protein